MNLSEVNTADLVKELVSRKEVIDDHLANPYEYFIVLKFDKEGCNILDTDYDGAMRILVIED